MNDKSILINGGPIQVEFVFVYNYTSLSVSTNYSQFTAKSDTTLNTPIYSYVLCNQAFEWKRGWS